MKNNSPKKNTYSPADCHDEFDIDNIWLKLTSQSTSYLVRADLFFVEATGDLLQAQATAKRIVQQNEKERMPN